MSFNPDYENIATAFVQHYYSKFDQGDGVQCKGRDSILAKFSSLTFKQIQRAITKCDSQPLYDGSILVMSLTFKQIQRAITKCDSQPLYDGSILVMVLGQLKTDDDPINPFSQIFILRPNTTGMVKQATKGQKEIYEENQSTILTFGAACLIVMVIHLAACFFLLECTSNTYIFFGVSVVVELIALAFMKSMAGARFDERGRVTDAGMDLNDPAAFGEYCKDVIILTVIAQVIALYSTYAYLILLLIPAAAAYKVNVYIRFTLLAFCTLLHGF
ncbi:nuclear transport factor 2 domain protein [Ancylostoma caninum]|uniref:Transmembrane protein 208 n=1 Tax=Ancylostoma caninum TaxID=29170 RepID=A0A368H2C4_ANCCA|nr:nuclear transport factor 2 domain protein [Ancylostoma caninum]